MFFKRLQDEFRIVAESQKSERIDFFVLIFSLSERFQSLSLTHIQQKKMLYIRQKKFLLLIDSRSGQINPALLRLNPRIFLSKIERIKINGIDGRTFYKIYKKLPFLKKR